MKLDSKVVSAVNCDLRQKDVSPTAPGVHGLTGL